MYKMEANENLSYEYEIVESSVMLPVKDRMAIVPGFGLKITVIDKEGNEYSQVYENVSPYREKAEQLLQRFANLTLSPYHLCEVMDDMIEEYIADFDSYAYKNIETLMYKDIEVAI